MQNSVFVQNDDLIHLDTFTSIFTKKFMILLISRVRHHLTITLRNPADKRGFFYLNNDFVYKLHINYEHTYNNQDHLISMLSWS
ncbi:hypothetical protein EXW39_11165 [Bacillus mycoides]|nr:hypothetical protein EXW39_11165 [Bacillus mycoides]